MAQIVDQIELEQLEREYQNSLVKMFCPKVSSKTATLLTDGKYMNQHLLLENLITAILAILNILKEKIALKTERKILL